MSNQHNNIYRYAYVPSCGVWHSVLSKLGHRQPVQGSTSKHKTRTRLLRQYERVQATVASYLRASTDGISWARATSHHDIEGVGMARGPWACAHSNKMAFCLFLWKWVRWDSYYVFDRFHNLWALKDRVIHHCHITQEELITIKLYNLAQH